MPCRATAEAPRPNKRFLRNILRETDSHNQALLAKEAEEARARLRELRHKEAREARQSVNGHNRGYREDSEERPRAKRRRVDVIATDRNRLSPPTEFEQDESREDRSKERGQDIRRRRREDEDGEEEYQHSSRRPHKRHRSQRDNDYTLDEEITRSKRRAEKHRRRRSRSRSRSYSSEEDRHRRSRRSDRHHKGTRHDRSRERSASPDRTRDKDRSHRKHRRTRSPSDSRSRSRSKERSHRRQSSSSVKAGKRKRTASSNSPPRRQSNRNGSTRTYPQKEYASGRRPNRWDIGPSPPSSTKASRTIRKQPESDSDPLEDIVGPLPPPPPPKVKVRGRGAISSSAMDSHFSASYDPNADVDPEVGENDDWELALEAVRDRARFKQTQGDRLRAAGFTEDEVKKWEKGGEKTEEDVRWAKKGEGREWDRGKVIDEVTGHVELQPEWGRLKGT
jgi:hypothetical protein